MNAPTAAAQRTERDALEQAIRAAAPALLDALRDLGIERLELVLEAGSGTVTFVKRQRGAVDVEPAQH